MEERILVQDLTPEQKEKLSRAARIWGRDEQEILDNLPEIMEGIRKAFTKLENHLCHVADTIVDVWRSQPPEFHAAVEAILAENECSSTDKTHQEE